MAAVPDDLARLFHEALEELAWKADAQQIADIVKRLNIGLPVEDEFMVISNWLGKCELIHKLDQHIVPVKARDRYQVPDLIARFSTQSNQTPVLIEVKSKAANTLSFQPKYLKKLQAYAELMGMPLLIAWKYHSVWMVFEPKHLKRPDKNFNITFNDAMRENIFGVLAGDFAFKVAEGAGVHLRFDKEKLVSREESDSEVHEQWLTRCTAVEFTGKNGEPIQSVSPEVQTLLTTWDLGTDEKDHGNHIWIRHIANGEGLRFSHSALVSLLDMRLAEGEHIRWRDQLRKERIDTIDDFRAATVSALSDGIVHLILDQQPHTQPGFLKTIGLKAAP